MDNWTINCSMINGLQAVCTEAGMFALRERRVHVTQEDFEMAVGKVLCCLKTALKENISGLKVFK